MARPTKWRNVCSLPDSNRFGALDIEFDEDNFVVMHVDEYETIRLIDLEGFNQVECAEQMNVARTTVTAIYSRARRKLANSLVNNKMLVIKGGEYQLCQDSENGCGKGCRQHNQGKGQNQMRRKGQGRGRGLGKRNKLEIDE